MEVVLNEGRNRQVRKITTAAGHRTIRLCRVAIGKLELDLNLNPGDWNYINKEDVLEE
jgi:16S rRNA U516 pseudouridylate synthase RsuA-like enzyme